MYLCHQVSWLNNKLYADRGSLDDNESSRVSNYLAATSRWTSKLRAGDIFRSLYQGAFVRCSTCLAKAVDLAVIAHGDTILMNVILVLNFVDVPSLIADAQ